METGSKREGCVGKWRVVIPHTGHGPGRLHGRRCANKWHPYALSMRSSESFQPRRGAGGFNRQMSYQEAAKLWSKETVNISGEPLFWVNRS